MATKINKNRRSIYNDNYHQLRRQLLSIRWLYCLRLKSDTSLGTSDNKFGFIFKDNLCQF